MEADVIDMLEEEEEDEQQCHTRQTCGVNTAERKERYMRQMGRTNVRNPKGLLMICRRE